MTAENCKYQLVIRKGLTKICAVSGNIPTRDEHEVWLIITAKYFFPDKLNFNKKRTFLCAPFSALCGANNIMDQLYEKKGWKIMQF